MKKLMLLATALTFNVLSAQESFEQGFDDHQHQSIAQDFDDNQSDNQEAIGAAENASDVGPSDVAVEKEKKERDVAQYGDVERDSDNEDNSEE